MKIKIILIVLFTITLQKSLKAQNSKTFSILENNFSFDYSKATKLFTICQIIDSANKDCIQKTIDDSNKFEFPKKLEKAIENNLDTYKFKIFEQKIKLSDLDNILLDNKTFKIDLTNLKEEDDTIIIEIENAPKYFPKFTLKKIAADTFEISNHDGDVDGLPANINNIQLKDDSDIPAFIKKVMSKIETNKTNIKTYYTKKIKSEFLKNLQHYYNEGIIKSADYSFLVSEELKNISDNIKNYSFSILLNKTSFNVKVCLLTNCKYFVDFEKSTTEADFINKMTTTHQLLKQNDKLNIPILGKIYLLIKSKLNAIEIKKEKKEFEDNFKSKIAALEKGVDTYSGQFVLGKTVNLYEKIQDPKRNKYGLIKRTYFKIMGKFKKDTFVIKENTPKLLIDSLTINIFNNRTDDLIIIGRLSDDPQKTLTLTNATYSLALREFRAKTQTNTLINKDNKTFTYYYDDVLDYLPYDRYNYAVKNGSLTVKANDTVKVPERKIGDYFTGIFFTDILGLNSNNANSLLTAEGRIRIPLNLRNNKYFTLFDNLTAYASVNLVGGLDDNSRRVILDDTFEPNETANNFTTDNFNLLVNNNIDAGISITPLTLESRAASTFIHFRYGFRFLRTGVQYNLKEKVDAIVDGDSVKLENILEERNFQVFSAGHEAEINFEIRPQSSVGADLTVGLNWLTALGTNKNDIDFSSFNNKPNFKVMANIYAFTDSEDSNSGVYVRIGSHYNLGNKKLFPQLMVGYATNLTSFVNKVSK